MDCRGIVEQIGGEKIGADAELAAGGDGGLGVVAVLRAVDQDGDDGQAASCRRADCARADSGSLLSYSPLTSGECDSQ